jgi:hypothetical protein
MLRGMPEKLLTSEQDQGPAGVRRIKHVFWNL